MTVWYVIGGIALALAAGIVLMGEIEVRRFTRNTKAASGAGLIVVSYLPSDLTVPDPPDFRSVEEIHSFYEELKARDPVRAGQAMYAAQLKLHGG